MVGAVATTDRLHAEAARRHTRNAVGPGGLAGGGRRRVQSPDEHTLPGGGSGGSVPLPHVCPARETAASWGYCHVHGCQVGRDLPSRAG